MRTVAPFEMAILKDFPYSINRKMYGISFMNMVSLSTSANRSMRPSWVSTS